MISKGKTLDQMYDLFAVRVIVDSIRECYEVLGELHETYKPVPGRVKDYIAMPKSNRYQSLHTTMVGHDGEMFEVQIRTWEMHRVAEYGIAAHWKYKEKKDGLSDADSEEAKHSWLRQILDWQREMSDSREYIDALKFDLHTYANHVYCFSPKGDVISLTAGSTPIDFAYAIHSAVGNKMVGARVNGRIVTFDYKLITGDRVEIMTSQNAKGPGKDWLKLVKTTQARSKINQWFRQENKLDNIVRGRELIEAEAKKRNIPLSELLADGREEIVLNRFNCQDFDALCAAVGFGGIREGQIINRLYNEYQKSLPPAGDEEIIQELLEEAPVSAERKKKSGIVVKGVGDMNVRFSKCCSPLPGDEIIGFITRGRGISVHRTDCPNIVNLEADDRKRTIEADWQAPDSVSSDHVSYHADLRVVFDDREGVIMDISRILTDERVKVTQLNARTVKNEAVITLGLEIANRGQLDNLCTKIDRISGARGVERVTS
jgi:GTP pyrophosphokinase